MSAVILHRDVNSKCKSSRLWGPFTVCVCVCGVWAHVFHRISSNPSLYFPFTDSSVLDVSLPLVSIQQKSFEKPSSVNKNSLVGSERDLLSDKTSHQAPHTSIFLSEAQMQCHHPRGLYHHLPFLPLCPPTGQSAQGGVEEDGRGRGPVMRLVTR